MPAKSGHEPQLIGSQVCEALGVAQVRDLIAPLPRVASSDVGALPSDLGAVLRRFAHSLALRLNSRPHGLGAHASRRDGSSDAHEMVVSLALRHVPCRLG